MKPRYEYQDFLFCNKCDHNIDKFAETLVIEGNVYCIFCDNWICGEEDAFGSPDQEDLSL